MDEKLCKNCGETKPVNEFYFNNKKKTVLKYVCKICQNRMKLIRDTSNPPKKIISTQKKRLRSVCKLTGLTKHKTFDEIFGTDTKGFKVYLEGLFYGDMSWENYSNKKWEVDHKVPLKLIKTYDDIDKLFHYTNLQPLLVEDHIKKSGLERGYVFKTLSEMFNDVQVVNPLVEQETNMSTE